MPAIALVFVAAKATCFVLGSLIHEGKELMKRIGIDHDDTSKASCLLIKDQQLGLQETPNESPSNALILYASREIVLSSSSRALAILSNDALALALETSFNVIESASLFIMKSFNFSAAWAWFRMRFIALMQSTLSSVVTDMKMAMTSFIASASERVVEKKAVASIAFLIQANFSKIMVRVLVILKEATRILMSRSERNMSTFVGHTFLAGFRGKEECIDLLPDSNSVGDSIDFGTCTRKYLGMVITYFKRALETLSHYFTSLLRPLRLHGLKVMSLVLLLFVGITLIGWSIPRMIFDGCKPEDVILQEPLIPEAVSGVEAGVFSSSTPLLSYLSDGTSNAFDLMGSMCIGNFEDLPSSMMTGRNDEQVDLNLGLADFNPSLHLWPTQDFSFSTTSTPDSQNDFFWDDKAIAASPDWNIVVYDGIQSKSGYTVGFGSALDESSLFMHVELKPSEDHASNGIATEHFDGYNFSTIADEAFVLGFNSQASQDLSSKQLDLGYNRYSDLMGSQAHDTHAGLDHPGLFMLLRSHNDFIAVSSSHRQTRYFWNHKAAVALLPGWNIEVSHCIRSESTAFICVLGDLWSDRFEMRYLALIMVKACDGYTATAIEDETLTFTSSFVAQAPHHQSSVESLGRSILSRSASDGNTLSMQMIVAELSASDEISSTQFRDFDRSVASVAVLTHPLLSLPGGSPKKFSAAASYGVLEGSKSLDVFSELRRLAWILLMLAYRNSDGATEEDGVLLSSESEMSTGTNLDLEEVCDDEMIFADEEDGADEALLRNTNSKPSRYELTALYSELGRHWKSPSKRRMRRSSRFRSRPEYFEPTWA